MYVVMSATEIQHVWSSASTSALIFLTPERSAWLAFYSYYGPEEASANPVSLQAGRLFYSSHLGKHQEMLP